jgi:uncharacterized membrane protein YhaH (DUF805 family)
MHRFPHDPVIWMLRGLYDPRGRTNRYGFFLTLVLAAMLTHGSMRLIGGFESHNVLSWAVLTHALWINTIPCLRRIHDVGYNSIKLLLGVPVLMLLSVGLGWFSLQLLANIAPETLISLSPEQPLYWGMMLIYMLPLLAGMIWLSTARGEDNANEYGDIPQFYGHSNMHQLHKVSEQHIPHHAYTPES